MTMIDELVKNNYFVLPNFTTHGLTEKLISEGNIQYKNHQFNPAGIGRVNDKHINEKRRSDYTSWIDFTDASSEMNQFHSQLLLLKMEINSQLFMGLFSEEFHYAFYPKGGFYESHVDALRGTKNRLISVILYLNKNWDTLDGGSLRIKQKSGSSVYIIPEAGTLVCFLSEEIEHEVCEIFRDRWSISGWFRCRET